MDSNLLGRQWLSDQEDSSTTCDVLKISAIENGVCNRCGSKVESKLPCGKRYCRVCIEIGRITEDDYLIRYSDEGANFPKIPTGVLTWHGRLTHKQSDISTQLVNSYQNNQDVLVHAVTGAGKTEMLFQLIEKALSQGERICIATPRIDVVNELYPRFDSAFCDVEIGKYHGRDFRDPGYEQLTICTTHQLMKFYQAFDLLVIDEVDSFPYANNDALHFAAKNAVKENGVRVFLTATPTNDLLEEVKQGKLKILKLNRRFHGGLLPVPKQQLYLKPFFQNKKINSRLIKEIIKVIKSQHQLLLFVPRIDQISDYVSYLQTIPELEHLKIEGVHAGDKNRIEKVEDFRNKQISILVTTTILERGVTFKGVWVIIVQADDEIYSTSSLVQIAGRVGRDKNDPYGLVLFCYHKYTAKISQAIKEIKEMNQ